MKWSCLVLSDSVTPWTVACQAPPAFHGLFQARILEWVAIFFSRGSSQPRDRTQVSHIVGRCFYHLSHQGSPPLLWLISNSLLTGHSRLIIALFQSVLHIEGGIIFLKGKPDYFITFAWNPLTFFHGRWNFIPLEQWPKSWTWVSQPCIFQFQLTPLFLWLCT